LRPLALPDFRTGERLERLAGGIQQKTLAVPGCTDEDARARPIPDQRVARQVVDAINLLGGAVKLHDRPGIHRDEGVAIGQALLELPDEGGFVSEAAIRRVETILCEEIEKVMFGGVPIAVESVLMRRWTKGAKRIVEDEKVRPWN
jgi:hypothetical protein